MQNERLWFNQKISSIKHIGEFISKKENGQKLSDSEFRNAVLEEWGRNLQRIGNELLEWSTPMFDKQDRYNQYIELKKEFESEHSYNNI